VDLYNLNFVMVFWFRAQATDTVPAALKMMLASNMVKKRLENNHLAYLVKIHDTLCRYCIDRLIVFPVEMQGLVLM